MEYLKPSNYQRKLLHCEKKKRRRRKYKVGKGAWEGRKKIVKKIRGRGATCGQYSFYKKQKSMVGWSTVK